MGDIHAGRSLVVMTVRVYQFDSIALLLVQFFHPSKSKRRDV